MKKPLTNSNLERKNIIYQWEDWEIILKEDVKNETIFASLDQIANIFDRDKSNIAKHIKNIYKTWELSQNQVVAFFATTALDWKTYQVEYFNLDMIISVWYRVNSIKATQFRKWATKTLKEHITKGFTINKNQIKNNFSSFLKTVEELQKLIIEKNISNDDILELVKTFANTWFSLDSFDKWELPKNWITKKDLKLKSEELYKDIQNLKNDLISKWQANEMFAQEKYIWNLSWIFWNIFASFDWIDLYETIEEKSSNLLYFVIKNHPFNDWNKRTWAFCFIWFLKKYSFEFENVITPEVLTTITLLIAQSKPEEKERMIWLVLLILNKK